MWHQKRKNSGKNKTSNNKKKKKKKKRKRKTEAKLKLIPLHAWVKKICSKSRDGISAGVMGWNFSPAEIRHIIGPLHSPHIKLSIYLRCTHTVVSNLLPSRKSCLSQLQNCSHQTVHQNTNFREKVCKFARKRISWLKKKWLLEVSASTYHPPPPPFLSLSCLYLFL